MDRIITIATTENYKSYHYRPMRYPIRLLRCIGFWPQYDFDRSCLNTIYFLYHITAMTLYTSFTLSLFINFFFSFDNLQTLTDNANILIVSLCNGVKVFPFVFLKADVNKCIRTLEDEVLPLGIEIEEKHTIFKNTMSSIKKNMGIYCILFLYTTLTWIFTSAVESMASDSSADSATNLTLNARSLPFSGWFPYDTTPSPAYEISYVFQSVAVFIDAAMACASDCFYFSLIYHACNQFKILNISLKNIQEIALQNLKAKEMKKRGCRRYTHSDEEDMSLTLLYPLAHEERFAVASGENFSSYYTQKEVDVEMSSCLARNIKHHQAILRFVREVNSVMSPVMLVDCLVIMLLLCTVTFFATTLSPRSLKFLSMVGFIMCEMSQLLLYCWFCSDLMSKSHLVQQAAYSSDWYSSTTKFKKSIRIIMMRSLKPAEIKALNFSTMSLTLFVALLKTSYSFFAVLRQMHDS